MKRKRKKKQPENRPWWNLPRSWKLAVACLAVASLWFCLHPYWIDPLWYGLLWMLDFRLWPLWYFAVIGIVLALSLHWFRFYTLCLEKQSANKWPVVLTGSVVAALLILTFCHRLSSFPLL